MLRLSTSTNCLPTAVRAANRQPSSGLTLSTLNACIEWGLCDNGRIMTFDGGHVQSHGESIDASSSKVTNMMMDEVESPNEQLERDRRQEPHTTKGLNGEQQGQSCRPRSSGANNGLRR